MQRRDFVARSSLALASAAVLGGCQDKALASKTLKAADVHPGDYPTVAAVRWIGEQLESRTQGEMQIKMYHSGQLGREADTIDLVRMGALDVTRVFAGGLNNAVRATAILGLPYLFESVAHQRGLLDGAFGAEILASLETYQLKGLAIYDAGARHLYANKIINVPDDLHGLKIRVPMSDLFIEMFRELGANPTPLAYGSVYSGLETGLIDGAENNIRSYRTSRHFETAKQLSATAHSYAPDLMVMSLARWRELGAEQQALLQQLARESVNVMRTQWDTEEQSARVALVEAGVDFSIPQIALFRERCAPLRDRWLQSQALNYLTHYFKG
jgi:tripartite ATP-independent transporter DctP family solute receptor